MKKITLSILISLLGVYTYGMSGKEYLKKVQQNYEELESLSLQMNYILYKGLKSDSVIEEYASYYYKAGTASYRQINTTEILTQDEMELTINHTDKLMVVSQANEISVIDADLTNSLKMCKDVRVHTIGKNKRITLILKSETDIPYSSISFEIDNRYFIQEITINFASRINFSQDFRGQDYDFPRLVIQYNHFKDKWKDKEGILNTDRFILTDDKGIKQAASYQDYEVYDMRK